MSEQKTHKTIPGTDGNTYTLVARRGAVGLGVRPLSFSPVPGHESEDQALFLMRLRSAIVETDDAATKVVNFGDLKLTLTSAWPHLTFEKVDSKRASVIVGVVIEGSPHNPKLLCDNLSNGKLARSAADYILSNIDEEYRTISKTDLSEVFATEFFGPVIEKLQTLIKSQETAAKVFEKKNTFINMAEALKKQHDNLE